MCLPVCPHQCLGTKWAGDSIQSRHSNRQMPVCQPRQAVLQLSSEGLYTYNAWDSHRHKGQLTAD